MQPILSIIIPAYNEEYLIGKTLESISIAREHFIKNTNEDIEIIVVDNMSSDKTVEIAKMYNVKIINEMKHNISVVRNTGVKQAQGDILCFLDADSKIGKKVLTIIYNHMQTGNYIGGGVRFRLDKDSYFYKLIGLGGDIISKITGMSGVLIYTSREAYEKIGGFNEKYYCGEDLNFVIRLRNLGRKEGKKFLNIFQCFIITSSRKFNKMTIKDVIWYIYLLIRPKKMNSKENCYPWYDPKKRGNKKDNKNI